MSRVAIVGAGPSGFYTADQLLKAGFEVDLLDALPTPFGLVRAGVAPDHPKIKSVTRVYAKTALNDSFRFFGGVTLGSDVSREELLERYHAVVYAVGTSTDNRLGIPGEDRPGSHPATEFVAWYNGHPQFADHDFDLDQRCAVVVGNGNVAIDVARMLVLDPGELAPTDTADHALQAFGAAGVTEVVLLGRRGPAQAAFTNPELRELGELRRADVIVNPAQLEGIAEPDDITRRKNVEILLDYSRREPAGRSHRVELRFLRSPVEILGEGENGPVSGVRLAVNRLVTAQDGRVRAEPTGEEEVIECGLVLRSIGYRGEPLAGIPFDQRGGLIRNEGGRVVCDEGVCQGEYVVGWIKRGPSGVIGTNKKDAADTVARVLEDAQAGALGRPAPELAEPEAVAAWLTDRVPDVVTWAGWEAIDAHESALGQPTGRPRVKLVRLAELVRASRGQDLGPADRAGGASATRFGLQRHFIGGEFVQSVGGATFQTLDPATGDVLAEVCDGRSADVDAAVAAARAAFDEGPWPRRKATERAAVLRRVAELIRERADELIAAEVADIGMPVSQMQGLAARAAQNFDYYAGVITELHGRSFQVGDEFLNYTIHKPVGVAGLIMPWNAPLMLCTWRIAPALAAGNTVVLKPAEWSPLTAGLLARALSDAGVPPGAFNVVHGDGPGAGAPLSAHPGVQLICFTGETTTGQAIIAAGAPTLKRSSVELGGKSPVVVFEDADPELCVDAAVAQIFTLNGQRCTAGSRLLIQRPLYEQIVQAVAQRARQIRVGDPTDPRTELGPLIHREHHERVLAYIQSAREQGARILAGGERPPGLAGGNFLQATVIADVDERMRVFREEIFGPVLVAMPFDDEAEAIRLANATQYGLAAYVWTNDIRRAHRVAHAIDTGMCWINSQNVRDLRTPFGGVKASGIGREGGDYAFEFYCEIEAVQVALGAHRIPRFGLGEDGDGDGDGDRR